MIKHRQTKYTLFYRQPGMIEILSYLWNKHIERYGRAPKRIYVTKAQIKEYLSLLPAFIQILYHGKDAFTGKNPTYKGTDLIVYEIPA